MKKVTNRDLQNIFDNARNVMLEKAQQNGMDSQQFVSMCYLESVLAFLGLPSVEYEVRPIPEPAEE